MNEPVEVVIKHSNIGAEGPGYYVWEVDAEDEGYVYFSKEKPRIELLRALICSSYVESE